MEYFHTFSDICVLVSRILHLRKANAACLPLYFIIILSGEYGEHSVSYKLARIHRTQTLQSQLFLNLPDSQLT